MKNHWINFFSGYVQVKALGIGIERFINEMVRRNIPIWNVKRVGNEIVIFYISLKDIHKLRAIVRKSDCKVTFKQRKGAPFLTKRLLKNSGFLLGFISFLLSLFILSNMVWGIEIKGAKPETEYQIKQELDKMGVEIGKIQFFLDDVETIQRKLSDRIGAITWIGVELKGTTYHFEVVEKKQPKEAAKISRQHLVASKKAIIRKLFVEKGQAVVSINDYVQKGQLLVSGIYGNEKNPEIVSAKGEIMGETWYKTSIEVPLKSTFSVFSGKEQTKHYITIYGFEVPVWGFKKVDYPQFETDVTVKPFSFLKWKLPISYSKKVIRDKEEVTREYKKDEAIKQGIRMAKQDLSKVIPSDAKIIGEKILHESIDNGKVNLLIHYQVIENIAIGQPIIQGD
ncbi:sporulation protein YqfD [Peribacillus alkalitolerans]|uniref:sporulation protein YqfD n=1 Tax=Peribacillus alkalitolerans TaxID=1550385 RepID=UPI0013D1F8F5|nr:sporulation protein YqfD [Peribacillus alkalitolerans]